MDQINVGKKLVKKLSEKNLTIEEMAKKMNVGEEELKNKIKGKEKIYLIDVLSITKILELKNSEVYYMFFN